MKETISYADFDKVDIRVGTVVDAKEFPEARFPAIQLWIDFGAELGILKSSAQITDYYNIQELIGNQLIAVVNFPSKQIGPFMSEVLVLGVVEAARKVVLLSPNQLVENGLGIM